MSSTTTKSNAPAEVNPETRLLTIKKAVEYLRKKGATGASYNFVRSLIAKDSLPAVRIGLTYVVSADDVDGWLRKKLRQK
jgi:excisionase family DNA binding protein